MRISAMKMENAYSNRSAIIVNDNSLTRDWNTIIPKEELSFIIGNPPFVAGSGAKCMSIKQKEEMNVVFNNSAGKFDYCAAWFKKASDYIKGTKIEVGFIATSGLIGNYVSNKLWNILDKKINFAYSQFAWHNGDNIEASLNVVIIGFADFDKKEKYLDDKLVESINANLSYFDTINKVDFPLSFRIKGIRQSPLKSIPMNIEQNDICLPTHFRATAHKKFPIIFRERSCDVHNIHIKEASFFEYGMLASSVFYSWVKQFGSTANAGMFSLSPNIYNCFPFPVLTNEQEDHIAELGVKVFLNKTEENYAELDRTVEAIYGLTNPTEEEVIKVLYKLYKEKIG
jgi:hypothetical protein